MKWKPCWNQASVPGGMPDGLPVPMLMVVQADTSVGDPSRTSIQDVLEDLGIDGDVAGNAGYAENVHGALGVLRLVALSIVALLSATAVAVIAFATHAALLARRRDIVDVLHLSGAEDRYIAGLFERRFWILALQAGLGGSVAALMVTALIVFTGSGSARGRGTAVATAQPRFLGYCYPAGNAANGRIWRRASPRA